MLSFHIYAFAPRVYGLPEFEKALRCFISHAKKNVTIINDHEQTKPIPNWPGNKLNQLLYTLAMHIIMIMWGY